MFITHNLTERERERDRQIAEMQNRLCIGLEFSLAGCSTTFHHKVSDATQQKRMVMKLACHGAVCNLGCVTLAQKQSFISCIALIFSKISVYVDGNSLVLFCEVLLSI